MVKTFNMSTSEFTSSNDLLVCANYVCEVTLKNSSFGLDTLKKTGPPWTILVSCSMKLQILS